MHYYVFICLDGVPILELFLNKNYRTVENLADANWNKVKYVILNYKTNMMTKKVIENGFVQKEDKILTKQINYYQINLQKIEKQKSQLPVKEQKIITFAKKIFFGNPEEFLKYVKEKKLFSEKDIHNFEKAMKNLREEQKLIQSWGKIEAQKNKN